MIRIEPPGGDEYRRRPPFGGPQGAHLTRQTDADLGMTVLNRWRDKKSVTLNLRDPGGIDLFLRLAARADVVVENFLPGTLGKIGLGFPVLEAANPKIVLCSISGFGQRGPYREWRAFDPIVQGMSGVSSITGFADRPPVRCGASISDTSASLYGVIGILSALRARERTGKGDWIDVSMLDGTFFMLAEVLEFVTSGIAPERRGNGHQGTVPFNVYRARDGWVSLCVVTADEWRGVLASLGRPELIDDPRFGPSPETRRTHREEIDALVQEWVGRHAVADAIATLQANHVPAGPVFDLPEVFQDPHMREREMVLPLTHPTTGPVPGAIGAGMPIKFQNHPARFDAPAPTLGADNADVYGRLLGLDAEALEKLRAAGLI